VEVPLWLKLAYSTFLILLIPAYFKQYGWANFLWFSDIALFGTAAGLWLDLPLLVGSQAVAVSLLESLWIVDLFARLLTGRHPIGLTQYMFKPEIPLWIRGLSLFHLWLPVLMFWYLAGRGYDPMSLPLQTAVAWVVGTICYCFTPPEENINMVFGFGAKPQKRLRPGLFFVLWLLLVPALVYLPTHLALNALFGGQ
jgi:hypothetical protein